MASEARSRGHTQGFRSRVLKMAAHRCRPGWLLGRDRCQPVERRRQAAPSLVIVWEWIPQCAFVQLGVRSAAWAYGPLSQPSLGGSCQYSFRCPPAFLAHFPSWDCLDASVGVVDALPWPLGPHFLLPLSSFFLGHQLMMFPLRSLL